jgi:hypothetical protein
VSLRDYKNASEILTSNNPTVGQRFSKNELDLLSPIKFKANLNLTPNTGLSELSKQKFEFHLYGLDGQYIAGNQSSTYVKKIDDDFIFLDVKEDINKLEYRGGIFKFVYNFLYDIVGSYTTDKLFISEISPSRKEIKLKLQSPENESSIVELENLFRLFLDEKTFYSNFVLNFGQNKIIPIANLASDGTATTLYVKLFDELPSDINEQTLVWIAKELLPPYVDSVQIDYSFENININTIRGPQTDLGELYWNNLESNYKSWTDLLSQNKNVSDKIENFVKSLRFGTELNVDFTNFQNFVFYGSAKERIDNFFFKIKLIEYYNTNVSRIEPLSSNNTAEILSYSNSINSIVKSFDAFERYLYYGDPDETLSTSEQIKTATISPYPKYDESITGLTWIEWAQLWVGANVLWEEPTIGDRVRVLRSTSHPEVIEWYENLLSISSDYDDNNSSQLIRTIPEHIIADSANDVYLLFINMIGHYYDNIWIYIENFNKKNTQIHNPSLGKPSDLLPNIAKEYNWILSNPYKAKDLWEYFFNLTEIEQLKTYDNSVSLNKLTTSNSTKHIWARIVNNLPYLLKSKGSARSVKALFATFGIPESIIRIKEYGGPGIVNDVPRTLLRKDYPFLNLGNGYSVRIPWNSLDNSYYTKWENDWSGSNLVWTKQSGTSSINSIYANILPDKITSGSYMNIFSIGSQSQISVTGHQFTELSGSFILTFSGSSGIIRTSASAENIFDGTPTTLVLQTDSYYTSSNNNITYNLYVAQEKYNKIVLFESCSISITGSLTSSYNNMWFTESNVTVGSFSNSITSNYFTGSINEVRFWKRPLKDRVIKSHTLSYRSYHDDTVSGSYENLLVRIPFWVSSSIYDGSFSSITTNKDLSKSFGVPSIPSGSYITIDTYISPETATIGLEAINPVKERIESSTLLSNLEIDRRREISSYDLYSNDSNKLKIGFSPQFNIDDDIQHQMGTFELDSYIDFDNTNYKYYVNLSELSEFYSKTQEDENPIIKYLRAIQIYDFTVFEQIKQVIPARTNSILGLIIENSLLQRVRIKFTPDFTVNTSAKQSISINKSSKKNSLKINRIQTVLSQSNAVNINQVDDLPVDIGRTSTTLGEFNVYTGVIAGNKYISASGEYLKKQGNLVITAPATKKISKYINYPSSLVASPATFTASFNNNFNYEVPIDSDDREYLNTNITNNKNLNFYKKIIYYYSNSVDYENNRFYSSSNEITEIGTYPYGKSRGLQNSTFLGTKTTAISTNKISLQPSLTNYSPVYEITGSQLQPEFAYELNEPSASDSLYITPLPFIPSQTS